MNRGVADEIESRSGEPAKVGCDANDESWYDEVMMELESSIVDLSSAWASVVNCLRV